MGVEDGVAWILPHYDKAKIHVVSSGEIKRHPQTLFITVREIRIQEKIQ
jgi:hypothetical protein